MVLLSLLSISAWHHTEMHLEKQDVDISSIFVESTNYKYHDDYNRAEEMLQRQILHLAYWSLQSQIFDYMKNSGRVDIFSKSLFGWAAWWLSSVRTPRITTDLWLHEKFRFKILVSNRWGLKTVVRHNRSPTLLQNQHVYVMLKPLLWFVKDSRLRTLDS